MCSSFELSVVPIGDLKCTVGTRERNVDLENATRGSLSSQRLRSRDLVAPSANFRLVFVKSAGRRQKLVVGRVDADDEKERPEKACRRHGGIPLAFEIGLRRGRWRVFWRATHCASLWNSPKSESDLKRERRGLERDPRGGEREGERVRALQDLGVSSGLGRAGGDSSLGVGTMSACAGKDDPESQRRALNSETRARRCQCFGRWRVFWRATDRASTLELSQVRIASWKRTVDTRTRESCARIFYRRSSCRRATCPRRCAFPSLELCRFQSDLDFGKGPTGHVGSPQHSSSPHTSSPTLKDRRCPPLDEVAHLRRTAEHRGLGHVAGQRRRAIAHTHTQEAERAFRSRSGVARSARATVPSRAHCARNTIALRACCS